MTGTADQVLMFALERKFSVFSMIEPHLGPTLCAMTILTLFSIAAFVYIILFVA
jgi:hypothetical protein